MHYVWVALVSKDWYYDSTKSGNIGNVIPSLDWDWSHHRLIFCCYDFTPLSLYDTYFLQYVHLLLKRTSSFQC